MTDDYKVVSNQELMDVAVPILNDYDAELREAISEMIALDYKVEISPENILITPGGKPIIFFSTLILGKEGKSNIYQIEYNSNVFELSNQNMYSDRTYDSWDLKDNDTFSSIETFNTIKEAKEFIIKNY